MDQYHQPAEEEDELTEMVCQETDLKDGQWVCTCEQMLIHMNSFNIETRVHRNKLLVTMQSSAATLGSISVLQFMYVIHVMC